jgi:hypothetical protein
VFDGDKSHISIIHHTHNGADPVNFNLKLYLELGCAAGAVPCHGLPSQSVTVTSGGSSSSIPSQKTPPSLVDATFVKIELRKTVFIALGFVLLDVPGKVIII